MQCLTDIPCFSSKFCRPPKALLLLFPVSFPIDGRSTCLIFFLLPFLLFCFIPRVVLAAVCTFQMAKCEVKEEKMKMHLRTHFTLWILLEHFAAGMIVNQRNLFQQSYLSYKLGTFCNNISLQGILLTLGVGEGGDLIMFLFSMVLYVCFFCLFVKGLGGWYLLFACFVCAYMCVWERERVRDGLWASWMRFISCFQSKIRGCWCIDLQMSSRKKMCTSTHPKVISCPKVLQPIFFFLSCSPDITIPFINTLLNSPISFTLSA